MSLRQLGRYYRRFFEHFFRHGFAWGRDNLAIAGLLGVAAILISVALGQVKPVDVWAQSKPVLYLYGSMLAGYVIVQFALTAWRLDREREDALGLPIDVYAYFGQTFADKDEFLTLQLRNTGPADELFGEIWSVQQVQKLAMPRCPVFWRDFPDKITLPIATEQTVFIQLARVPDVPKGDSYLPKLILYSTNGTEIQNTFGGFNGNPETAYIHVRFNSQRTGQSRDVAVLVHLDVSPTNQIGKRHVFFDPAMHSRG